MQCSFTVLAPQWWSVPEAAGLRIETCFETKHHEIV